MIDLTSSTLRPRNDPFVLKKGSTVIKQKRAMVILEDDNDTNGDQDSESEEKMTICTKEKGTFTERFRAMVRKVMVLCSVPAAKVPCLFRFVLGADDVGFSVARDHRELLSREDDG